MSQTEQTTRAAERFVATLLVALELPEDDDDGIHDGYTYAHERKRTEGFMLAGNGPTAYAWFVFTDDGEIDHAYLEYYDSAYDVAPIPVPYQEDLLIALRKASKTMDGR